MKPDMHRLPGFIAALVLCFLYLTDAQAEKHRFRYDHPYRYSYPDDSRELRQDMTRLREKIDRQQRQIQQQVRQQREQTRLLRQQASSRNRLTAMQACYYRFNAGLDLCGELFDVNSKEYAACHEKVVELNPGCAGDIAKPALDSKK